MELTHEQTERLSKRFPKIELSYETVAHKKVSSNYDICVAIPSGKKKIAWFTYHGDKDACFLLDLNKDQQVTKMVNVAEETAAANFDTKLALGTVLYGSLCDIEEKQVYIIEDIYFYCGLPMRQMTFGEKLTHLKALMSKVPMSNTQIVFALPYMCLVSGDAKLLDSLQFYESITSMSAYTSHHVQFRSSSDIVPYLNHVYKKRQEQQPANLLGSSILFPRTDLDHNVQSKLKNAVFKVTADIQNDVYHLFAMDGYINIAYIGSRDSSVFMNGLFRTIRENENIDYGEESEDEEMFQNTSLDKYVDLKKECKMHCVYHTKFRKWVPISVVDSNASLIKTADLLFSKDVDNRSYNQRSYPKVDQRSYQKPYQKVDPRSYQKVDQRPYQKPYHQQQSYQKVDQRSYQKPYQKTDGPTCYKPKTNYYKNAK
jgi:hypothetical protein